MWIIEFIVGITLRPPFCEEGAITGKLYDAAIASICNVNITIQVYCNTSWIIEFIVGIT